MTQPQGYNPSPSTSDNQGSDNISERYKVGFAWAGAHHRSCPAIVADMHTCHDVNVNYTVCAVAHGHNLVSRRLLLLLLLLVLALVVLLLLQLVLLVLLLPVCCCCCQCCCCCCCEGRCCWCWLVSPLVPRSVRGQARLHITSYGSTPAC
jgi:hypothetical protein